MVIDQRTYDAALALIRTKGTPPREELAAYLQLLIDAQSAPAMAHLHTRQARLAYVIERLELTDEQAAVVFEAHRRLFDHRGVWCLGDGTLARSAIGILLGKACPEVDWDAEQGLRDGLALLDRQPATGPVEHYIQVLVLEVDAASGTMLVRDLRTNRELSYVTDTMHQGVNQVLPLLDDHITLPVRANLLNSRSTGETHVAEAIVLDPDFMIDATTIASCFTYAEVYPERYLVSLLTPGQLSEHIIVGQVINEVLDRLLTNQEVSMARAMTSAFERYALALSTMSDDEVRYIVQSVDQMITNLYHEVNAIRSALPDAACYVEPTFISSAYGIQGRLDALFLGQESRSQREVKIIELKTGKVFMPNEAGVNRDHHAQSTIYHMLIHDAYEEEQRVSASILYAKETRDRLRAAPPTQQQRRDILHVRNKIIAGCHHLMDPKLDDNDQTWMGLHAFERSSGYIKRDAEELQSLVNRLDEPEAALFNKLVASMMRDQYRAKVGAGHGYERAGFATLWRGNPEDKLTHYRLLKGLRYVSTDEEGRHLFSITEEVVSNFNKGDIVVLYPADREMPLRGQLLKGVITTIDQYEVGIQLRNELVKVDHLALHGPWCAEPDHIDASLRRVVSGVVRFYKMPASLRRLYMGMDAPSTVAPSSLHGCGGKLTDHQQTVVMAMLAAPSYYLLWGPPGTGKTSQIIKTYVEVCYHHTEDNQLLTAYTNRAVDEMCAQLDEANIPFIRIGSRHSTHPRYADRLLQSCLSGIQNRKQVVAMLAQTRVVVGTVASLLGRDDLFHLMKFHRMIVDEASQLLEPVAMGLIARVPRAVLVGDHKQLPAISLVEDSHARIEHPRLQEVGYEDVRMSMFERLYLHAHRQSWHHVIGQLFEQGRMHESISQVASALFYDDKLHVIDVPAVREMLHGRGIIGYTQAPTYGSASLAERLLAIDVPSSRREDVTISKQNDQEAGVVIKLLTLMHPALDDGMDIGVICPFRAQIVRIKHGLDAIEAMTGWRNKITIDTVERYQGSERSIILFNTCAGNQQTLNLITSMDTGGVDRKMNVALTRSKYHFVLVGDLDLLRESAAYAYLIDRSVSISADLS